MKQGLVIWGASGHALVVAEIIRLVNTYQIIGLIDDMKPERAGSEFAGYEVLGGAVPSRAGIPAGQPQSIREQRLPPMFRLVPDR